MKRCGRLTGGEAGQQQDDPAAHSDTERHAEAADECRHGADDERELDRNEEHVGGDQEEHVRDGEPEPQAYTSVRHTLKQLCLEPRTSALNKTLPAGC